MDQDSNEVKYTYETGLNSDLDGATSSDTVKHISDL